MCARDGEVVGHAPILGHGALVQALSMPGAGGARHERESGAARLPVYTAVQTLGSWDVGGVLDNGHAWLRQ